MSFMFHRWHDDPDRSQLSESNSGRHERKRPEAQWIGLIMWDFRWNHGFDPANMMVSCQCSSNSGAEVVDFDESIQDGATLILYRQRRGSRWCLVGISRNAAFTMQDFVSSNHAMITMFYRLSAWRKGSGRLSKKSETPHGQCSCNNSYLQCLPRIFFAWLNR